MGLALNPLGTSVSGMASGNCITDATTKALMNDIGSGGGGAPRSGSGGGGGGGGGGDGGGAGGLGAGGSQPHPMRNFTFAFAALLAGTLGGPGAGINSRGHSPAGLRGWHM